jgi:predicted nucleic acid-binding protein
MRYLLDTNIVSALVRNPNGNVAQHIRKVGEAQVCTSIIVAAELRHQHLRDSGLLESVRWLEMLAWKTGPEVQPIRVCLERNAQWFKVPYK